MVRNLVDVNDRMMKEIPGFEGLVQHPGSNELRGSYYGETFTVTPNLGTTELADDVIAQVLAHIEIANRALFAAGLLSSQIAERISYEFPETIAEWRRRARLLESRQEEVQGLAKLL